MREHFPDVQMARRDWIVAADGNGLRVAVLRGLVDRFVGSEDLLVEVNRRIGDFLPVDDAMGFVSRHVGQGEIRICDRQFRGFVVVALNGVATGWESDRPLRSAQD